MISFKKFLPIASVVILSTSAGFAGAASANGDTKGSKIKKALDWENLSVNNAFISLDVLKHKAEYFKLQIDGGVFPVGSFNGGGTGSKAILAINNWNKFKVSEFQSVQYTAKSEASYAIASILYLNVIVDLKCDGSKVKILTADPEFQSTPIAVHVDGFKTYRIEAGDAQFRAVGGISHTESCDLNNDDDCNDLGESPAPIIVHPNNPGTGPLASLNNILAVYPNACFVKKATGDGGMPKSPIETSSFLFVIGSSSTTLFTKAELKDIRFNDRPAMAKP